MRAHVLAGAAMALAACGSTTSGQAIRMPTVLLPASANTTPCSPLVAYTDDFARKLGAQMRKLREQGGYAEALQALADYHADRKRCGAP